MDVSLGGSLNIVGTLGSIGGGTVLMQTVPQLSVTLNTVLTSVLGELNQLDNTINGLATIANTAASQLTGILDTNTFTLSTASTIVTQLRSRVTAATIKDKEGMTYIITAAIQVFGTIFGSVTRITQVLGPVTAQVQSSLGVVAHTTQQLFDAGFKLNNESTETAASNNNSFTAVLAKVFAAVFEFIKSVQAVTASVLVTIATASNADVEAVNALAVIFC